MSKYAETEQLGLFNADSWHSGSGSVTCLAVPYSADSDNWKQEEAAAIERIGYRPERVLMVPVDLL